MRTAVILVGTVVIWVDTFTGERIVYTDRELPVVDRKTKRPGICAEVIIEGTVFLHDDNDMLDLGACQGEWIAGRRGVAGSRGSSEGSDLGCGGCSLQDRQVGEDGEG